MTRDLLCRSEICFFFNDDIFVRWVFACVIINAVSCRILHHLVQGT